MTRTVNIVAKNLNVDFGLRSMHIQIKIATTGLTKDEVDAKVERLRDQFFQVAACHFNVSQIKQ